MKVQIYFETGFKSEMPYFLQAGKLISGSQNEERINVLTTRYSLTLIVSWPKYCSYFLGNKETQISCSLFLVCRIKDVGLAREQYEWYLDIRRHGTVKHSGFSLEFDLMVLFATGLNDVRDVIPFPRTHGKANY